VNKLKEIPDLDITLTQAWQLVELMAKELEMGLRDQGNGEFAPKRSEFKASAQLSPIGTQDILQCVIVLLEQQSMALAGGSSADAFLLHSNLCTLMTEVCRRFQASEEASDDDSLVSLQHLISNIDS